MREVIVVVVVVVAVVVVVSSCGASADEKRMGGGRNRGENKERRVKVEDKRLVPEEKGAKQLKREMLKVERK